MYSDSPQEKRYFPYKNYNITIILLVINVVVFFLTQFSPEIYYLLMLNPESVFQNGFFWQVATYMFVHSPIYLSHIFFNMLALIIFGLHIERRLGSIEFLIYYLVTGIAGGIVALFLNIPVVGASGAIYGLLLAFATLFPRADILLFFLIPVKAPILVLIFAGMAIFFQITGAQSGVAHLIHLTGLAAGYFYFLLRLGINPVKVFFPKR
jgi:membrane associated rhomboid family serine protease